MNKRMNGIIIIFVLVIFVFCAGSMIVEAAPGSSDSSEASEEELVEQASEALLSEFDFSGIEESLERMLPQDKVRFEKVVGALISGDLEETGQWFIRFIKDQLFYEFSYNRKAVVYIIMAAFASAVFSNFADAFRNRQISDVSFYVIYMLVITLCITAFHTTISGLEEGIGSLTGFMQVFCPVYFMAVAFASGSTSALFFYNVVLFLIYVAELLIIHILLPAVNIYIMIRVLGNVTDEDFLSELSELIRKAVVWTLRFMVGCVVGINVIQGLLAPAVDTVRRSAVTRTAEAVPWVGDLMGGTAEVLVGTAVLIKNGIGMAGALTAVGLCAAPALQMLVMALLYRLAAAVVQPVSDNRITSCISSVSEGYELLLRVLVTTGALFLLTIAITASFTS